MIFKVPEDPNQLRDTLKRIAQFLESDKVGAIPTETFYALACNPFSEKALERLFILKKREPNKPILLLLGSLDDLSLVVSHVPALALKLIKKFWPGPLTLVLPARRGLPKLLTANLDTIGVRLSSCELTRKVAQAFGNPITGTSANLSGSLPCKNPEEIAKVFPDLDFILDDGDIKSEKPSTVVEILENKIKLIREGLIPFEKILRVAAGEDG
ncbi:MAG: L-threonylcarbamoyladenylate synthase [Caldimicrobium sp.]